MIKDTEEQPGEVVRRARSGRVPVQWGRITLPAGGCVHQPGTLGIPYFGDFCGGFITQA